jgi:hypothetical protein
VASRSIVTGPPASAAARGAGSSRQPHIGTLRAQLAGERGQGALKYLLLAGRGCQRSQHHRRNGREGLTEQRGGLADQLLPPLACATGEQEHAQAWSCGVPGDRGEQSYQARACFGVVSHQQGRGVALWSGVGCLLLASGRDPVAAESVLPFGFGGQLQGQAGLARAAFPGDQRNVGLPVGDQPLAQRRKFQALLERHYPRLRTQVRRGSIGVDARQW